MRSQRIPAVAVAIVAAFAVAACAPAGPATGANPTESGVGAFGSAEPTGIVTPTSAPAFPATAKAYSEAVLAAWKNKQTIILGDLTTPTVQEQILEIPGPPLQNWTYVRCDEYAASSQCLFFNPNGDEVALRISHPLLGQAHAADQVVFGVPKYPSDGVIYVKEFVAAWKNGNTPRMLLLSKPAVVNQVGTIPAANPVYPAPVCCGGGLLQVVVQFGGASVTFDVGTTLLGMQHAIVGYAP